MPVTDQRSGRRANDNVTHVAVGVASGELVPQRATRVLLVVCPPTSGEVYIVPSEAAVVGRGLKVSAVDGREIILTERQVGRLVRRQWFAISSVPGNTVTVIESTLTDEEHRGRRNVDEIVS